MTVAYTGLDEEFEVFTNFSMSENKNKRATRDSRTFDFATLYVTKFLQKTPIRQFPESKNISNAA